MINAYFSKLGRLFQQDRLLQVLVAIGLAFSLVEPGGIRLSIESIDWKTISSLAGLMLLTKGIETSGYLSRLGLSIVHRLHHERPLAVFLVLFSAFGSMLVTNDIMLFIIVPLTLGLRKYSLLPIGRLIIFEALAVNAGSLLTPIGNPQNIFLWQHSNVSFFHFIGQMLPLETGLLVLLVLVTVFSFPNLKIEMEAEITPALTNMPQLYRCLVLYLGFVLAMDWNVPGWGLLILMLAFIWMLPEVLMDIDWSLMAVFIMMFYDVGQMIHSGWLSSWLVSLPRHSDGYQFFSAVLASQFISNVPAALLLQKFILKGPWLAYAVNVGGFGFFLGSLANLIALRMARERAIWLRFHLFSFPFLVIGAGLAWVILGTGI
ncbi:MAG: anion transporter [Proteobacteria bacterium]|nr:anion transporter [Pseudomonadota bacterium]